MARMLKLVAVGSKDTQQMPRKTVEVALTMELGFAALKDVAQPLVDDESGCSLKYVDSDGDSVTIASDADLREVGEYMEDEHLESLEVLVRAKRSVVQQHFKGIVAAVTKLTHQPVHTKEAKREVPTVAGTFAMLRGVVEDWDVTEDADVVADLKTDLVQLLSDDALVATVDGLSALESYSTLVRELLDAIVYGGRALDDVVAQHWEAAVGLAQQVLVQCPGLKRVLIRVAKAGVSTVIAYNAVVSAEEEMPELVPVAEVHEEKIATATLVVDAGHAGLVGADVVHKGYQCDGCNVQPIVGPRYRSQMDANFDLCRTCYASGAYDESKTPFEEFVKHQPVHYGFICDGCDMEPIAGVRYKSFSVANFDLCQNCEASGKWESHEPFIKINQPEIGRRCAQSDSNAALKTVHPFVACDGCEVSPLIGKRYKSTTVEDFDLCESCHGSSSWQESHGPFVLIETRRDVRGVKKLFKRGQRGCRKGGRFGLHGSEVSSGSSDDSFGHHGKHGHGHHGHHGHSDHHHGHHLRMPPPPPPPHSLPSPHHHIHQHPHLPRPHGVTGPPPPPPLFGSHPHGHASHRHRGHNHGHHHSRFGSPHRGGRNRGCREYASPVMGDATSTEEVLSAAFLADVTIPDGTHVAPETDLVKSWKLRNDGNCMWPEGCQLKMQTGRCGVPPFEGEPGTMMPSLASGEVFVADVSLRTPSEPGRYTAYWRMCDPSGKFFGHRLWIHLIVSEDLIVSDSGSVSSDSFEAIGIPSDMSLDDKEMVVEPVPARVEVDEAFELATNASTVGSSIGESPSSIDETETFDNTTERAETQGSTEEDPVAEMYEDALGMLEAMGFGDKEQNRRVLAELGGNLADAVNSLLLN